MASDEAITQISFSEKSTFEQEPIHIALLEKCVKQLEEYFSGDRIYFDLPIKPSGTDFQNKVWSELNHIGYGDTISYLELARRLGDEKCIRAAGSANGKNPIPILIPCHRVIGTNGKLVGYSGELWRKEWLLKHEAQFAPKKPGRLF